GGEAALIQIGSQRIVAGAGKAVGHPADLVVETPPLLDHDDPRPSLPGCRQIAFGLAPVGTSKLDHRAHRSSSLEIGSSDFGKCRHDIPCKQLDRSHGFAMTDRAEGEVADVVIHASGLNFAGDVVANLSGSAGDSVA